MIKNYSPEMGEAKPALQGEVRLGYSGTHSFVDTPLKLKTNRSIKLIERYTQDTLIPGSYKIGWYHYRVTEKGLDALKKQYDFSREVLLD